MVNRFDGTKQFGLAIGKAGEKRVDGGDVVIQIDYIKYA